MLLCWVRLEAQAVAVQFTEHGRRTVALNRGGIIARHHIQLWSLKARKEPGIPPGLEAYVERLRSPVEKRFRQTHVCGVVFVNGGAGVPWCVATRRQPATPHVSA